MNEAYQKISYYFGLEQFKNRRYSEARPLFEKSIQHPIDKRIRALAHFWLAETHYNMRNFPAAANEYKNFTFITEARQTPYYAAGFYGWGYANFQQEKFADALTSFNRYLSLQANVTPNHQYYDALLRSGDSYFGLKNHEQAIAQYDKIINQNTQDADYATYQKAIIRGLQNRNQEKITLLRNLITRYANSTYADDALYEIANTYFNESNYALAMQDFQNLIRNHPRSPYYRVSLLKIGLIHYNQQEDDKAMTYFKQIVERYTHSAEAREAINAMRNIYIDRGQADSLFAFMRTIPDANLTMSLQDSLTYEAAFSHVRRNDCTRAIQAFEEYNQKFPRGFFLVNSHFYLAECANRMNSRQKALRSYEAIIERSPNHFVERAALEAAGIHMHFEQFPEALKKYQLLEEVSTGRQNTIAALSGQMRSHFRMLNFSRTIETAKRILDMPQSESALKTEARFYMAKSYMQQNQHEMARVLFEDVTKENRAEIGAEALYNVAHINFLQDNNKLAQDNIFALRDNYANYEYWVAKGYILLADIFVKAGDDFQAKHTLQSIIGHYEGEELKRIAREKLDAILKREQRQ